MNQPPFTPVTSASRSAPTDHSIAAESSAAALAGLIEIHRGFYYAGAGMPIPPGPPTQDALANEAALRVAQIQDCEATCPRALYHYNRSAHAHSPNP